MLTTNPYLHFMGNAEEAMNFYKSVFGGTFTSIQRYKEFPGGEKMKAEDQEKLIHISLTIGNGAKIMASDALESMEQKLTVGTNYHICVEAQSEKETEKFFELLSKSGKVEMPLNKTFWGAYFGMCRDQYGVQWMINYTLTKSN